MEARLEDYVIIRKMLQSRLGCDFREEELPPSLKARMSGLVQGFENLEYEKRRYSQLSSELENSKKTESEGVIKESSSQLEKLDSFLDISASDAVLYGGGAGLIIGMIVFIFTVGIFGRLLAHENVVLLSLICLLGFPVIFFLATPVILYIGKALAKRGKVKIRVQQELKLKMIEGKYEKLRQQLETERMKVIGALENTFNAALDQMAMEIRDWKIKEWKGMGFNVTELDKIVKAGNIDLIKRIFNKYDEATREFVAIRNDLKSLNTSEFDEDFLSLKREIDLLRVDKAMNYILSLKGRIEEFKKSKLKLWGEWINEWIRRGYRVQELRKYLKKYSREYEDLFEKYKRAIEELEEIKRDIDSFELKGFGAEILFIEDLLKNPDKIMEVIENISSLKAKVNKKTKEMTKKWVDMTMDKVRKFIEKIEWV